MGNVVFREWSVAFRGRYVALRERNVAFRERSVAFRGRNVAYRERIVVFRENSENTPFGERALAVPNQGASGAGLPSPEGKRSTRSRDEAPREAPEGMRTRTLFRLFHFFRLSLLTNLHICAKIDCVKNIAELCNGSTADSDSVRLGSNPGSAARKKHICLQMCFFQLYSPCGEFYAQVRDMSFGRDMRFAR